MTISNADLSLVVGGQAPTPTPTPTPSPTVPDDDDTWKQEWDERMKQPAPWSSCTGGFWHGCTEGDRYR
jgi:hypothetical protein